MATVDPVQIEINATLLSKYNRLKKAFLIVFSLFILSLFTIGLMIGHNVREQNRRFEDARTAQATIATQTARIESAGHRIDSIQSKVKSDSLETKVAVNALKSKIAVLLKALPKRDVRDISVMSIRDSVQLEVISLQDSVINGSEISAQVQVKAIRDVISLKDQQLKAKDEIIAVHAAELDGEKLKTKHEKRGKNFWKGMFMAGLVAAAFIATQ